MRLALSRNAAKASLDLHRIEKEGLALRATDPAAALARFDAVLARDPDRIVALRAAGRLLMKGRQLVDAEPLWERLAFLERTDPEPHVQLARIFRGTGRPDQAAVEVREALSLAPHHAAAQALDARLGRQIAPDAPSDARDGDAIERLRRWAASVSSAMGLRKVRLPRLRFAPRSAKPPRAPVESPTDRLFKQAERQADAGDQQGLLLSLDLLLELLGPTTEVLALMRRHRQLAPAVDQRLRAQTPDRDGGEAAARLREQAQRQADANDRAGLLKSIDLLLALVGPTPETAALIRRHRRLSIQAAPQRRIEEPIDNESLERLLAQGRRQADAEDRGGLLQTIEQALSIAGATPEVLNLMRLHRRLAAASTQRRLVPTFDDDTAAQLTRLQEQAGRQAVAKDRAGLLQSIDLLLAVGGNTPETAALVRRHRRLSLKQTAVHQHSAPTLGSDAFQADDGRLLEQASRQAIAGDRVGLLQSIDLLLEAFGPTPEVSALMRQHRRLAVESFGEGRIAETAAGHTDASFSAISRLLQQAHRQEEAGDAGGLTLSVDLLLQLVGETPEISALARRQRELAKDDDGHDLAQRALGDARLIAKARQQARAQNVSSFVETLETIIGLTGPTADVAALVKEYHTLIENAGATRLLALVDVPTTMRPPSRRSREIHPGRSHPEVGDLLNRLASDLEAGDVGPISQDLERLCALSDFDDRARSASERHIAEVLERLSIQRTSMAAKPLSIIEKRLVDSYSTKSWVRQALARQRENAGNLKSALQLYNDFDDSLPGAGPALFHAAVLSCGLENWKKALTYALRAISAAPNDRNLLTNITELFLERGRQSEAEACWREAKGDKTFRLWARVGLIKFLEKTDAAGPLIMEGLRTLHEALPLAELVVTEQNYLIDVIRRIVQAQSRVASQIGLTAASLELEHNESASALRNWIIASFKMASFDYKGALRRLDEGLQEAPVMDGVLLDLHAEKALIFARYHLYGEALDELELVPPERIQANTHYGRRFEHVRAVAALCENATKPLRYPECLVDLVLEESTASPMAYEAQTRHVSMISGSLGQGGGERQTITVVRRILKDPHIRKLCLLVRSTHLRANDDFFLKEASALPLDMTIYGADWSKRTNAADMLPEYADRPRLLAALELMPHNMHEEVIRVVRLLLDQRPQAVHIWQDMYQAALACVIAGVPRFFVHRGSLAPDFWAQNEYQTAVHFRPMRHTYRRLLERPDFVLANNSIAGCETDRNWVEWPERAPFQVVYNAVDFSQLGAHTGRNFDLRRELGIPDDANLVGGSFRIVPVKRPLYWIEAARRIQEAVPGTHFLIIGDGDMTEEVAAYAAEHGFADLLHLPGRVSNVGDWYRAMDLKLLTSEREGIPNALIEAQHFGVPIIATAVGGIHEAIELGQTGYVVSGDEGPGIYADKVIEVLRNPEWHENARCRAPDFVHEKFSLDGVLRHLMDYYGIADGDA